MEKTEQKILKFIDDKKLILKNDKVLIALSGGSDSVFLFHFLTKYKKRFRIELGAVHINHKLRAIEADNDEKFCKDLCDKFTVPIFIIRKNIKAISKKEKLSLEEAGREVRYSEFTNIAQKNNYSKIATAHTSDDNAETVFLNLIKGTGIKGLAGIPYKRGIIIRPVLILTKAEILKYLDDNKLPFRTDASNFQSDYDRNYIRNEIFPLIRIKLNPSFEEKLMNTSSLIRSISNVLEKIIDESVTKVSDFSHGKLKISLRELKKYDTEFCGDIFKRTIERYFDISPNYKNLEDINTLLTGQVGSRVSLAKDLIGLKERNEILFFKKGKEKNDSEMEIKTGHTIKLSSKKLSIINGIRKPLKFSSDRMIEFIDADGIDGKFLIRKWKSGDRFHPIGMKGTKKISDFLNEQKISSYDKKNQLVLTYSGKIVWVVGLRLDERFKVTNRTNRIIELCLK
jgi:tRNA(Ile)-lysidine synthase